MAASPQPELQQGGMLSKLNDRERRLLTIMVVNFAILAVVVVVILFRNSLNETRDEIDQYDAALDALTEYGPRYIENQNKAKEGESEEAQRFSAETLSKNDLKLTSFIATHASAVDVKVDKYDEDSLPLTTKKDDGPLLTENQVKLDIREAELKKLLDMLDRIEKSPEPVIIKRINLRELRKKPGKVRANVVVATYFQKEREE